MAQVLKEAEEAESKRAKLMEEKSARLERRKTEEVEKHAKLARIRSVSLLLSRCRVARQGAAASSNTKQ